MTASDLRHPTGDHETGADIETRRQRAVPDLAADVVDVAAAETVRTAEVEVGVGEIVQPRTPHTKTDRKIGAAVRTDRKEIGRRRKTN